MATGLQIAGRGGQGRGQGRKPNLSMSELSKLNGGLGRFLLLALKEVTDFMTEPWKPKVSFDGPGGTAYNMGVPPKVEVAMNALKHYTLKAGSETPVVEMAEGDLNLPPQVTNILIQQVNQYPSPNSTPSSVTRSISVAHSVPQTPMSNGNGISSKTVESLTMAGISTPPSSLKT